MFNDELERVLLDERQEAQSIQAWSQLPPEHVEQSHLCLRARLLCAIGRTLFKFGVALLRRFGSTADFEQSVFSSHDHTYA